MLRLRFFKIALPAALLIFVALLVASLRDRPSIQRSDAGRPDQDGRSATGVRAVRLDGQEQTLEFEARLVEPQPDGGFHLEWIERLGIARKDNPPLIVKARGADIEGPAAGRRIVAQDEVVVTDPEADLVLRLPRLEVDEAAGEARSEGEIVFEGAGVRGRASRLVYGLAGQSSQLDQPILEHSDGAVVKAERMVFLDGLRDVELHGAVEATRGLESFVAESVHVKRDDEDRVRWAQAEGSVDASVLADATGPSNVTAERLEAEWDALRVLERFSLWGEATVTRSGQSLSAERIDGRLTPTDGVWELRASGSVFAQGTFGGGPAWVRSESLRASLNGGLGLRSAQATGHVRFEGPDTRAEADRAEFEPHPGSGAVRLFGADNRKARLARGRTRIAAERITTDDRGARLEARGRVEATLMPGDAPTRTDAIDGLFQSEHAIHFIADELDGAQSGERLVFRDGVRGWQGERNLSADVIELDGATRSLAARGRVTTRAPRQAEGVALSETDFVQVMADRLDYDGVKRVAIYRDHVRLVLLEGWLEADSMELLNAEAGGIERVTALGGVRLEFKDPDPGSAPELVSGTADRVEYEPAAQTVRLFGEERPATVRRLGAQGGATSGRVLRYRLDTGTLEVESGEQAPARIRGR